MFLIFINIDCFNFNFFKKKLAFNLFFLILYFLSLLF